MTSSCSSNDKESQAKDKMVTAKFAAFVLYKLIQGNQSRDLDTVMIN